MTDLELIFSMLGEAGTTEIAHRKNAQGFMENRSAAKEGGAIAGNARKALEAKSGRPVVSGDNFLELSSASETQARLGRGADAADAETGKESTKRAKGRKSKKCKA